MARVEIRGWGVAAACCAHLLDRAGFGVVRAEQPRAHVPAIVVSAATQALMCDVFGQAGLFRGLRGIERRVVAWGRNVRAVELAHSAVVISEEELIVRAAPTLNADGPEGAPACATGWKIFASRPLPEFALELRFGSRRASAVSVELGTADSTCWVESLDDGWLFLIPGWLIAVGGGPDVLLGRSRLVAEQVHGIVGKAVEFPAYPRLADPLCAEGWLACGSAAMAFDPICGDGTGNAVREAILASAVIRAAERGEDPEALLAHYRARLLAGFRRHLELAIEFYRSGDSGPWWGEEIRAMERGLASLPAPPGFRYRLENFDLIPVSGR